MIEPILTIISSSLSEWLNHALDFLQAYGYFGLFIASFLAATILPFSSDVVFIALLGAGLNWIPCLILASLGNWLGGMTNYYLGKLGKLEWIEKYLKIKPEKIYKMQHWIEGKGGEVMAVALGYMRADKTKVAIYMLIGKTARYAVELILFYYGIKWMN